MRDPGGKVDCKVQMLGTFQEKLSFDWLVSMNSNFEEVFSSFCLVISKCLK